MSVSGSADTSELPSPRRSPALRFSTARSRDRVGLREPRLRPRVPKRIGDRALRRDPGDRRSEILPVQEHIGGRPEDLRLARGHDVRDGGTTSDGDDDQPLVAANDGEVVGDRLFSGAGAASLIVPSLRGQFVRWRGSFLPAGVSLMSRASRTTGVRRLEFAYGSGRRSSVRRIVPEARSRRRFLRRAARTTCPSSSSRSACWNREARLRFRGAVRAAAAFGIDLSEHRARALGLGDARGRRARGRVRAGPRRVSGRDRRRAVRSARFSSPSSRTFSSSTCCPGRRGQRRPREPRRAREREAVRRRTASEVGRGPGRRLGPAVPADVRGDRPDGRDHRMRLFGAS